MRTAKIFVVIAFAIVFWCFNRTHAQVQQNTGNTKQDPASRTQPKADQKGLDDIFSVVSDGRSFTAAKTERLVRLSPNAVTVITRRQIEDSGAHSLAELLRLVPGLNYRMTPMGNFYGIRSFGSTPFSTRVLLLVDGFPFNSPDKGGLSGHPSFDDFFPIEQIRRIEVVKGPGSVLYGQNAFQGIINIITRDPEENDKTELDFYGGASNRTRASITTGAKKNDFAYTFTGKFDRKQGPLEYQRTNDVEIAGGDAYFRAAYKHFEFTYLFHRDTYTPFQLSTEETDSPEQDLNMITAAYAGKITKSWSYTARALYNRRNGTTCAVCHDSRGNGTFLNGLPAPVDSEHETNQRAWFDLQFNYAPANGRHNLMFGAQYQADIVTKEIVQITDKVPEINTSGFFFQDEIKLSHNLTGTFGARLDDNSRTGVAVSPTASLVYQPLQNLIFRGLFARAYREPTWNEFFINQRFLPVLIPFGNTAVELRRVGNPLLQPEKINTAELGGEYFIKRNYSFKLDTFYSYIQDYIQAEDFTTLVGFGGSTPPRPADIGPGGPAMLAIAHNRLTPINTAGGEAEFHFRPSARFYGNFGYAFQTVNVNPATDSQSAYSPKHKFTLVLDAEPFHRIHANFNMNTVSSFSASMPGLTQGLTSIAPGGILFGRPIGQPYALANFSVAYEMPMQQDRRLRLSLNVNDLFNQKAQLNPIRAIDTGLRGTQVSLGINYKF
ncbi:MAG TPA: TonB-dependent receptor [Blastocatellia bacterium]|nr:TonB-dependent receptor [Blastocatellia bacterium]